MKKIILLTIVFITALSCIGQTYTITTSVKYQDTLFTKNTTYSYHFDSTLKYVATQYWNVDYTLIIYDTVWYYQKFRVIDSEISDSVRINKWPHSQLLSGVNIKTINSNTIIGPGDVLISGLAAWGSITGLLSSQLDLQTALNGKQASGSYLLTTNNLSDLQGASTANISNSTNKNFVTDAQATVIGNTSGTNSGDNAANSTYANDYRAANFVAGTNYLAPNGNGSAITGLTKTQVGLANADNTSDVNKPVSTATQTALDGKLATNGSAAALTSFPTLNQNTNGSAATLTTPRLINGQSFNGSADIETEKDILAYKALGSPILAETVGQKLFFSNVSTALVDGQIKYTAVYLPRAQTITGIKVYVRVLGSYTADNNNRVGLYTYSAGTITLVASSTNSGTLWTSAANAIQTIPFSSTYAAAAGIYFVGVIYNNSAQVTAPTLASGVAINNLAMSSTAFGFTNSAKLYGTSTGTDIPASIAMSSITASIIPSWVSLY